MPRSLSSRFSGKTVTADRWNRRTRFETLEVRQAMAADSFLACGLPSTGLADTVEVLSIRGSTETARTTVQNITDSAAIDFDIDQFILHSSPVPEAIFNTAAPVAATTLVTSAALLPLSSIPVLNSLAGAAATLYLDFDGHFESRWGQFINVSTPAYDFDNNVNSFSDAELDYIQQIWAQVAEDYAPFNINVTTVEPSTFNNGQALRLSIGGTGSWLGSTAGGIGYIDAFTNSIANTAYVFAKNLGGGHAKYVAEATSHEAGHSFGLDHQSQYSATGVKIKDYYAGPGDGRAPIMGDSYNATRGLWWYGTPGATASRYQDDMAIISRSTNGFGYRADDVGNNVATASALNASNGQANAVGVITHTADTDYYRFTTNGGDVSLSVVVPQGINNLDARLELRDAAGNVMTGAAPADSFGASVTVTLPSGTYYAVVASQGNYGDVGQYQLTATIANSVAQPPADPLPTVPVAPSSIAGNILSTSQVSVTWTNVADETGYRVERAVNGGAWAQIAVTGVDVASYVDSAVAAGTTYQYRVRAFNDVGNSAYSDIATVVTASINTAPAAPTNLTGELVSSRRLNLSWRDNSNNETGFIVQRSHDARNWQTIGQVGANVTGFSDVTISPRRVYYYRVVAVNGVGYSAASNILYGNTFNLGRTSSVGTFGIAGGNDDGPATVERDPSAIQYSGGSNKVVNDQSGSTPQTTPHNSPLGRTKMFQAALDLLMSTDDWQSPYRRGF